MTSVHDFVSNKTPNIRICYKTDKTKKIQRKFFLHDFYDSWVFFPNINTSPDLLMLPQLN